MRERETWQGPKPSEKFPGPGVRKTGEVETPDALTRFPGARSLSTGIWDASTVGRNDRPRHWGHKGGLWGTEIIIKVCSHAVQANGIQKAAAVSWAGCLPSGLLI